MPQDPAEPTSQETAEPTAETPPPPTAERHDTPRRPAPPAAAQPARPTRVPGRDPRTVLVVVAGLAVVLLIALVGFLLLPGPVEQGLNDTRGAYIVAVASAALTAVGTMVTAYVGVKAANVAREDTERASLRHEIRTAALAGAAATAAAAEANRDASEQIRELGL